jgi:hypothetical protein
MGRDSHVGSPFNDLELTPQDKQGLEDLAASLVQTNFERYITYLTTRKRKVDLRMWKLAKEKEKVQVFTEKPHPGEGTQFGQDGAPSELPAIKVVGTLSGRLDDLMFGVVNPTEEVMRIKASYVEDISGAAILASIVEPTLESPFESLAVKWMELVLPLNSINLVKNRDYVLIEGTGYVQLPNGEQVGYHLLHSVNFPQTHHLSTCVRANMSKCGFFRQVSRDTIEVYATGIMDPGGDLIRMFVIPSMAGMFLRMLRYASCGLKKKLTWLLEQKYNEAKVTGSKGQQSRDLKCVTCSQVAAGGMFGTGFSACKLCNARLCSPCKIQKKLSFMSVDLELTQRKIVFCTRCMQSAAQLSAVDAAKTQIISNSVTHSLSSSADLKDSLDLGTAPLSEASWLGV